MKAVKVAIVMILVLNAAISLYNWATKDSAESKQITQVETLSSESQFQAADGLDLIALTALTKEIRSGQELERRLNEAGSINNLDLNGDDKVDYINVNEFGNVEDKIGFALTTQPVKDETQEIATITVEKNLDTAEIQVIGNEQIYGAQAIYNDSTPIEREPTEVARNQEGGQVYHNYFYPRPLWISPWYFGFYPAFFSPFPIISRTTYVSRMGNRYQGSGVRRGGNSYQRNSGKQISNPYRGKTANKGITRSLRNPTSTQRQFQATRSKNLRSGGFGRGASSNTLSSTSRSATSRSSSGQTSRNVRSSRSKSFGSLFSNNSRSSTRSSSFRSSSFGSRSFSYGK